MPIAIKAILVWTYLSLYDLFNPACCKTHDYKNLSDMTMPQDDITFPNSPTTPAPTNETQTASPNEVLDVLIDIPF